MTDEERGHIGNGVWLCRMCHKAIDSDQGRFTIEIVQAFKDRHEEWILDGKPNLENARKKSRILPFQGKTVSFLQRRRERIQRQRPQQIPPHPALHLGQPV